MRSVFEAAGLTEPQFEALCLRLRELAAAEAAVKISKMHHAAGGEADFDSLVTWGQKNLAAAERIAYDKELNGPEAVEVVARLIALRSTKDRSTLVDDVHTAWSRQSDSATMHAHNKRRAGMSRDWDWHADEHKESVVIQTVEAVAIYTNEAGNIVIRQQNTMGDDDAFVVLPKQSINAVIKGLRDEVKRS